MPSTTAPSRPHRTLHRRRRALSGLAVVTLGLTALGACSAAGSAPAMPLESTTWKLRRLGDRAVEPADKAREPRIALQAELKRLTGVGGCNRLSGTYVLDGARLTFGRVATTMMACPQGMELERDFVAALGRVARWRIEGQRLELLDEAGASLAQFDGEP